MKSVLFLMMLMAVAPAFALKDVCKIAPSGVLSEAEEQLLQSHGIGEFVRTSKTDESPLRIVNEVIADHKTIAICADSRFFSAYDLSQILRYSRTHESVTSVQIIPTQTADFSPNEMADLATYGGQVTLNTFVAAAFTKNELETMGSAGVEITLGTGASGKYDADELVSLLKANVQVEVSGDVYTKFSFRDLLYLAKNGAVVVTHLDRTNLSEDERKQLGGQLRVEP